MFHVDCDDLICTLWNHFQSQCTNRYTYDSQIEYRKSLFISLELQLASFENSHEFIERTKIAFILSGNTSVFVAEYKKLPVPLDAWVNTSNHDSCWYSDGVRDPLHRIYFRMAENVNNARNAKKLETIAPIQMSQFCHFGSVWNSKPFEFVSIRTSRDGDFKRKLLEYQKWE